MNRVICINDSDKPEEISNKYWIVKGQYYTVINEFTDMLGIPLYQLAEVDLVAAGTRYKGFATYRFAPIENVTNSVKQYQTVDA